jgi:hypothetical protein
VDRQFDDIAARVLPAWALFLLTAFALWLPVNAQASPGRALLSFEGKLVNAGRKPPVLKAADKTYQLTSSTSYVLHTLQDNRLNGREIKVEATQVNGNTLNVSKFFGVRDGKLYRVRYYCETCNIVALEPGRCVCCQQPTELQEVPVSSIEPDAPAVP